MSSSGACDDAVPSTSRAGMEAAASAGKNERPTAMADEEQVPRYFTIDSGGYQVVHETNEASSTQENPSGDLQLWPIVTPEVGGPTLTTTAGSHDIEQPVTISTEIQQQSPGDLSGSYNVQPLPEHTIASFQETTYQVMEGISGLVLTASSSGACHSVPSTSRTGIEGTRRGYEVRPTAMADEEQVPRYFTIGNGGYQAVQERNEASSTQENPRCERQWKHLCPVSDLHRKWLERSAQYKQRKHRDAISHIGKPEASSKVEWSN
ncbi:hypothetical protein MTO96_024386 [Rhipicephalus appendiculatus]